MNPVVVVYLLAAILVIALSIPLIRGKVKPNPWYGVRIPAAFASEEAWFDINRFGGRLLLRWGIALAITALAGAFIGHAYWIIYNFVALAILVVGLAIVIAKTYSYADKRDQ